MKGRQKELIMLAKGKYTWRELSGILNCSEGYLVSELRYEKRYLSQDLYNKLCTLANKNFGRFVDAKLGDNWGRVKGGINSLGNTKKFVDPSKSEALAELFGIILGDGHVEKIMVGNNIRCYSIVIAGDSRHDNDYLSNYIPSLFEKLLGEKGNLYYSKSSNTMFSKIHGKKIVEFVEKNGIMCGNKKKNNQPIPKWILDNPRYLRACLRGLIDTDGCIYYISKNNKNLRISYTSYIPNLMNDVRESFLKLGFHPSKVIVDKYIYLSRKDEIQKYLKEIGFSNQKHLKRPQNLTK